MKKVKTAASFVYDGKFIFAGEMVELDDEFLQKQNDLLARFGLPLHEVLASTETAEAENPKAKSNKAEKAETKSESKEADDL